VVSLEHLEDRVVPTSYTVTTTADLPILDDLSDVNASGQITDQGNAVTLRSAIIASNHTGQSSNTITLPANASPYKITQGPADDEFNFNGSVENKGDFDIGNNSLTITGGGAATTIIDGNNIDRIFDVQSAAGSFAANGVNFSLSGVTLQNGHAPNDMGDNENGGAIQFDGTAALGPPTGQLTLSNVVIKNNTAEGTGGGIHAQFVGGMTLTNVTFDSNKTSTSAGGALYYLGDTADGSISITNCTFNNNKALAGVIGSGGAIRVGAQAPGSTFTITGSTFSNNQAGTVGGAVSDENGSNTSALVISNTTFSGNTAATGGGAINVDNTHSGPATLNSDTLTNNRVTAALGGGGINGVAGPVTLNNTIVAGNFSGAGSTADDARGTFATASTYDLFGTGGSGNLTSGNTTHNLFNVANPGLASLGSYGGTTQTVALLPGSPALDAGTNAGAAPSDQRGSTRTIDLASQSNAGDGTDIGAFETNGFTVGIVSGNNQSAAVGTAFANPLVVSVAPIHVGDPVNAGVVTFVGPTSGASINPSTVTATVSGGQASASVTANGTTGGPYTVNAAAGGNTVGFSLTNVAGTTMTVTLVSGTVTVTDTTGGGNNDNVTLQTDGTQFIITNTTSTLSTTIPGASVSNGGHTVSVPFNATTTVTATTPIQVNTLAGNDTVTVDYSLGNFRDTISYDGGTGSNSLTITGETATTTVYDYTGAHSGDVKPTTSSGTNQINYQNLAPLTDSGTAADMVFNLPAGTVGASLQDDGTSGNGKSQLSSTNSTFETTTFTDPTHSLTINGGGGTDTITTAANLSGDFHAGLSINGTQATDTVTLNALTLNAGTGSLSVTAHIINVNAAITATGTVSGFGTIVNVTAPGQIQIGVDLAASGGTVNVAAGTYAENVTINKAVILNGAKAGVSASTRYGSFITGADGPKADPTVETVLTAPVNNPTGGNPNANDLIRIIAGNVTINGLVIDGNNPALDSGGDLIAPNGVHIHARRGIQNSDANNNFVDVNNLLVEYNIIQNIAQRGIELSNDATAATGNLITQNYITNFGADPVNGGLGIILFTNAYANVTTNAIVDTVGGGLATGLQLQNFFSNGSMTWSGNTITVAQDDIGIVANLFYAPAGVLNITSNTINAAAGVTATDGLTWGIYVLSVQVGSTLTLSVNTIGSSGGEFARGIDLWNLPTTATVTVSGGSVGNSAIGIDLDSVDPIFGAGATTKVAINNATVNGATYGIVVETDTVAQLFPPPASVSPTASVEADISGGTFTGGTAGIYVHAPAASSPYTAAVKLSGGVAMTNGGIGLLVDGGQTAIVGSTLSNAAFSGQSGNYITLTNGALVGTTLNGTGASYSGVVGNSLTLAQAFAVEDLIADAIDLATLGFVRIQAGHVFVTPNSFLAPAIDDTGAIQRAVAVAASLDTVNVEAGTYFDNVTVNKSLTLLGANSGIDPNTGVRGPETVVEPAVTETSMQGSTSGTIFRVGTGAGHVDVTIDGFTIDGHNANLTGGRTLNGVMIDTGAGIINSIGSFDTNPGAYDTTMTVQNNIIQNLERYGVLADNTAASPGVAGNVVSHNKIDNLPSGNNFGGARGRAIAFEDNVYGTVSFNVITRVNVGWQDDNYSVASPGAGTLVDHNTIHTYHRGIFHNLQYSNATAATISNNSIFVDTSGLGASGTDFGLELISIEGAVGVTVTNNNDTGNAFGVLITGDTTTAGITVSGGTLSGNKYGVYVTDNDPQFPSDGNTPNATISGATITGATNAGVFVEAVNGQTVGATLTGGTSITSSVAAIKGTGFATLTLANVSSSGNTSGGSIAGTAGTVNITPAGGISVSADAAAKTFGDGALQTISYAGATLSNLNLGTSGNNNAFTVKPVTGGTTAITVDGGLPYPVGNTSSLTFDLSAVTNPVIHPTGPGAGFLTTTPPANSLSWTHISAVASPALRFDFNTATSPTQLPTSPPTPGGFIGVQATDSYSAALGYGWVTAPVGSFDRGAIAGEADSSLLRDGVYGDTTHPATFRTDLPNGTYQVTVIQGDQISLLSQMNVAVVAGSGTGVSNVKTMAGQFAVSAFQATVSSGQLSLQFSDAVSKGGQWVLNGLVIQPIPGTISFTSGPGSVAADGTTVDTINGTAPLPDGSLITVSTSMGTIVSADADTHYAGTQVVVNGGAFSFQIQRPFAIGTPTFTAVANNGAAQGSATNPAILNYTELPARRFDFNGSGNATAAGFIGVNSLGLYSATLGYGWQGAVSSFDRGSAPSQVTQALYRDGAYGGNGPTGAGTFEFQVATGSSINIRVYAGDQISARSNITVSAEGGASVPVPPTAAGSFTAVTLVGTDTNGDGIITVTISESVVGAQWVANGMDVWTTGNDPGQAPQLAAGGEAKGGGAGVPQLTQAQLAPIARQAIAAWTAAGISQAQIALLNTVQFQIGTLAPGVLGQTGLAVPLVRLDATAAGYGWFIDPTPARSEEFTNAAGQQVAKRGTAAYGHMDLLTVVEHELGHVLGIDDLNPRSAANNLMAETLAAGVRREPTPIVVHQANPPKRSGRGM
jgi:predicted outer membrane repeat protein